MHEHDAGYPDDLISRLDAKVERLTLALRDLIEAAENRVPGDDALWADQIAEAQQALSEIQDN